MKRRKFAKNSTLALGSLMMLRCKTEATMKEAQNSEVTQALQSPTDFGLQLWSVRDAMAEDPHGTLKALSAIGYSDVEAAGYSDGNFYGIPPKKFKTLLGALNLKMRSSHTNTGADDPKRKGTMINDWERLLNDVKEAGANSIVLGYLHDFERKSMDDYKRIVELLNKCGEQATTYGLKLGYHNHDFEFDKFDGKIAYDMMLETTDPEHVFFEMDHYWVKKGGEDSLAYFKKYPGRFPVWHVKDMDATEEQFFTEVGSGVIDYVDIFTNEKEAGLQYFYVEQDEYRNMEPLASVEKSHDYLKDMKY